MALTKVTGLAYPVLHEDIITLADTAVTALFAAPKQVIWAEVLQHPSYGDVKISLGAASTPTVTREVDLKPERTNVPPYDLADINVQANAGGDKLVVRYVALEYYVAP